jgi:hypothetical protein
MKLAKGLLDLLTSRSVTNGFDRGDRRATDTVNGGDARAGWRPV